MVDRNYKVLRYFEAWMQLINPLHGDTDGKADNQVTTLRYPKDYKCTMSIMKFNKDYFKRGIGFAYYCFVRSWPLSMSSIPVNYESGSMLKLNVTFRYERYVMENVTRGMIRSGWKGYSDSFDPWMGRYGDFESDYFGYNPDAKPYDFTPKIETSNANIKKLYNELKGELPVNAEGGKVMNVQQDFLDTAIRFGIVEERNGRYYTEDGIEMKIEVAAIDTGGHFTDEVYRYAKDRINLGVIAIKGVARLKSDVFLSKPNKIKFYQYIKVKFFCGHPV